MAGFEKQSDRSWPVTILESKNSGEWQVASGKEKRTRSLTNEAGMCLENKKILLMDACTIPDSTAVASGKLQVARKSPARNRGAKSECHLE